MNNDKKRKANVDTGVCLSVDAEQQGDHDDHEKEFAQLIDQVSEKLEILNIHQGTKLMMESMLKSSEKMSDDNDGDSDSYRRRLQQHNNNTLNDSRIVEDMQICDRVILTIGEQEFHTTKHTLLNGCVSAKSINVVDTNFIPPIQELTHAQDNIFKLLFDSGISMKSSNSKVHALSFENRNPQYFEYILEHLRQDGRVKSLGIEKLNINDLQGILEECRHFRIDKLANYVQTLLQQYHKIDFGAQEIETSQPMTYNYPIPKERTLQCVEQIEKKIQESKENISKLSQELSEKFSSFIVGSNIEGDLSVKVNVGGQYFFIPFTCLKKYEGFLITKYISSPKFRLNQEGCIFIDRNPILFAYIHGYIISNGNFYHFPKQMSEEKKFQLKKEAQFYGLDTIANEYLDPLRYPVETLGEDNIKLKKQEDKLRELFAKDRSSPILEDPYLTLSPLFSKIDEIQACEKYHINPGTIPRILELSDKTKYVKQVSTPCLVDKFETFETNWYRFTQGALEGLDWSGVFAGGGAILGCCLKNHITDLQSSVSTIFPASHIDREMGQPSNDDNEDSGGFIYCKKTEQVCISKPNENVTEYKLHEYKEMNFFGNAPTFIHHNHVSFSEDGRRKTSGKFKILEKPENPANAIHIPQPNIPPSFKNSDIDLFLYAMSEEEAEEKIKHIYHTIKKNMSTLLKKNDTTPFLKCSQYEYRATRPVSNENQYINNILDTSSGTVVDDDILVVRTKYAVTFYTYMVRPIQVVLRIYKSPAEILLGFDIDCATLGFDGKQVWSSPRAIRALMHKTNLVDVDRQSTTYEYRLYKYAKRGFSVSVPGYSPSKVKNQLLLFPRRFIFQQIEHLLVGLAKLLAFDAGCKSKNTKHILGFYDSTDNLYVKYKDNKRTQELLGLRNPKSDYLDLSIIKSDRYPPRYLFEKLKSVHSLVLKYNLEGTETKENAKKPNYYKANQIMYNKHRNEERFNSSRNITGKKFSELTADKNWKPFFIYSLNDISTIINNETQESKVSKKIEFLTVDPGTQEMIGSFQPTKNNFYRDAYQLVPFSNLPVLNDHRRRALWYKSLKQLSEDISNELPQNQPSRYHKKKVYNISGGMDDIWFELFPPDQSNLIERTFRNFHFYGHPTEFFLTPTEKIDFTTLKQYNQPNHETDPNSTILLSRIVGMPDFSQKRLPNNLCHSSYY